jgi:LacI family sucrose operon transcriptional repressor
MQKYNYHVKDTDTMAQKKNVTFDDIAKYTNFSKTTISRYFNNPDSLTLKNQGIIAQALIDLDYKENKVARILANGKTEFIGIIIPNLVLHYYSEMLSRILSTYETFGYKFLVFAGNEQEETERRYIQELLAYKIEGLIILSHTIPSRDLAELPIPIVTIEREDEHVCSVNSDNYSGGRQAASFLHKHNCDVLLHINSPADPAIPAYGRMQGFLDYCQEHHLPHRLLLREIESSYESIQTQLTSVLDEIVQTYPSCKKGIFISNDTQANVLLNLLYRKFGRLPKDYLLVGFDNSPISREGVIPFSTVGQQIDKLAYETVSLLVELMNERKKRRPAPLTEPVHKIIPTILFDREAENSDLR